MKRNVFSILFFALSFTLLNIDHTKATTILECSFDQVCQGSELIFEGRIISKETRPLNGKPFTYFTYEIIEVIKGSYTGYTVEIGFMGGQSGDYTLKVSGMQMPEVGERGIYFVENLGVQQVHPLSGWHQGHYLVKTDKQTGRNVVIPMKDKDSVNTNSLALTHALTLKGFKQNIRNVIKQMNHIP